MADSDVNTVLFVRNPMLFLLWEKGGCLLGEGTGQAKREVVPLGCLGTKRTGLFGDLWTAPEWQ